MSEILSKTSLFHCLVDRTSTKRPKIMKKTADSRMKFSSFPFGNHCCWKSIFKLKFWQKLLPNNQQNLNDNDGDYRTGTTITTTSTSKKTNKRNSHQVIVGGKIKIENGNGSHRYLGKQQQQQQPVPEPRTKNDKECGNKKQHSKQETKQQQRKMKIIVFYANDHPNWFQPNSPDNILFNEFNNNDDDDDGDGCGGVGTLLNQCCCVSNNQQHRHDDDQNSTNNKNNQNCCQQWSWWKPCQHNNDNNHVLMEKMFQLTMINVNDYHHQQPWNVGNTMDHPRHGHHGNTILSEIFDKLFEPNQNQPDRTMEEEEEEYSVNDMAGLDGFGFCIIISDQMTQFINDDILDIEQCLSFVLGACSTESWRNNQNGDILFSDQISIPIGNSSDMNKFITYALYDELNEINMFRIKYKLCHCAFIPVTIRYATNHHRLHDADDCVNDGNKIPWTMMLFQGIIRISNENLFIRYQSILQQQQLLRQKRRQPKHERCQPQRFGDEAVVAKEDEIDGELYGFGRKNFRTNLVAGTNFENPYEEGCLFRVFPNSIKKPNEQILVMLDRHRQQVNDACRKYPGNHHHHHNHNHHKGQQCHLDVLLNGQSTINWLQMEWINDSMFLIAIPDAFFQPNTETPLNITIIIDCRQVLGSRIIKCDAIGSDDVLDASMAIQDTKLESLETLLFSRLNSDQFLCQTFAYDSLDELDENLAKVFDESLADFGIFQYISQPFNINLWLPTWLHFAAAHGLSRFLAKLLRSPASIPACLVKNSAGLDAIELAKKYHHENIVEVLEKHFEQIKHMKQDLTMLFTEQIQSKIIVNRLSDGPGDGNDEIKSQIIQNDHSNINKINKNEKKKKMCGKEHDHRTTDNGTKKKKKEKRVHENNDDENSNKKEENETRSEKNDACRMLESKTDNRTPPTTTTALSTTTNIINLTPSHNTNHNDDDVQEESQMSAWNEKILNSKYELLFIIDQFKKGISIQTFRELFQQWETVYEDVLRGQMSDEFLHSFNEIKKLCLYPDQPATDLVVDDDDDLEKDLDENGYSQPPKVSRPFHKSFTGSLNTSRKIQSSRPSLLPPSSSTLFKYEIDLV